MPLIMRIEYRLLLAGTPFAAAVIRCDDWLGLLELASNLLDLAVACSYWVRRWSIWVVDVVLWSVDGRTGNGLFVGTTITIFQCLNICSQFDHGDFCHPLSAMLHGNQSRM